MILKTVCKSSMCAGCMACIDICPRGAISIEDSLKAYNAVIDADRCINCKACYHVCQENNPPPFSKPLYWKEGWAEKEEIRRKSSSGGFAAAIEKTFVRQGGIICSCIFINGNFEFIFAETEGEIEKFAGSKYVKSNPAGIYKKIKELLCENKKVLFVGLPCQAAALRNYVGEQKDLYLIDLICHGSPSPKILDLFLQDHGTSISKIAEIRFRVKNHFNLEAKQRAFTVPVIYDNYTMTFLEGISYTENCYSCKFARLERITDITLGDSWGSMLPEEEQRKGISLALCQTEKGWELLNESGLYLLNIDLMRSAAYNGQLRHPSVKPYQREKFFRNINNGKRFKRTVFKCYPKRYLKNILKTFLYHIGIIREDRGGGKIYSIAILERQKTS